MVGYQMSAQKGPYKLQTNFHHKSEFLSLSLHFSLYMLKGSFVRAIFVRVNNFMSNFISLSMQNLLLHLAVYFKFSIVKLGYYCLIWFRFYTN